MWCAINRLDQGLIYSLLTCTLLYNLQRPVIKQLRIQFVQSSFDELNAQVFLLYSQKSVIQIVILACLEQHRCAQILTLGEASFFLLNATENNGKFQITSQNHSEAQKNGFSI